LLRQGRDSKQHQDASRDAADHVTGYKVSCRVEIVIR
jgi:hypothetical protein